MAAVTLGDLMNPLTKIEEYTKQTSDKLSKILELSLKPFLPTILNKLRDEYYQALKKSILIIIVNYLRLIIKIRN